jgi:hypothetical protein
VKKRRRGESKAYGSVREEMEVTVVSDNNKLSRLNTGRERKCKKEKRTEIEDESK